MLHRKRSLWITLPTKIKARSIPVELTERQNRLLIPEFALPPRRGLTTVGQKPSIESEQATSSYSFRSSELSQLSEVLFS